MAAGLWNHFQQPLNASHGVMTVLTSNQIDGFTPYIEFARAAYCDSSKIAGWKCGGKSFLLHLCGSVGLSRRAKTPAMLFLASYQL